MLIWMRAIAVVLVLLSLGPGCTGNFPDRPDVQLNQPPDASPPPDGQTSPQDATSDPEGPVDVGTEDTRPHDVGPGDAGDVPPVDTGSDTHSEPDADAAEPDVPAGPCHAALDLNDGWQICETQEAYCELGHGSTQNCDAICQVLGMECLGSADTNGSDLCDAEEPRTAECRTPTPGAVCRCGAACTPSCGNNQCGADGCGGECGAGCDDAQSCQAGRCVDGCQPQCDGRVCGDDGCGGVCGPDCNNDQSCQAGRCVTDCEPQCVLGQCGPDGCGGQCPECRDGTACDPDSNRCVDLCQPSCPQDHCGDDGCGGPCFCTGDLVCIAERCQQPGQSYGDLVDNIVGFGRGARGGAGYPLCTVTTTAETGTGSLGWCLGTGRVWVRFANSGTYRLTEQAQVSSYTTIDGRGAEVIIAGRGIRMRAVEHVVLHNLEFAAPTHFEEAISIGQRSQHVWIDQVTVRDYQDTAIEATMNATDVTISRSLFSVFDEVLVVGRAVNSDAVDARITFHHNHAEAFRAFAPRLRWGRAHAFNNVIQGWDHVGMATSDRGQLLAENNIFTGTDQNRALETAYGQQPVGLARVSGNRFDLGMVYEENLPEQVFRASDYYPYTMSAADGALYTRVVTGAGRKVVPWPN